MTNRRTQYNFSEKTKGDLAKRAGCRCSNPNCNAPTASKISVGEAAHIYSASLGAARYNPNLSVEEYCDISNGIHLCANCHTMIDKDPENHPAELLLSWKVQSEENASKALGKAQPISNCFVYKQELQIVFDRFEQQANETSTHSELVTLFCEMIIPFLLDNKYIKKIRLDWEAQFDQLNLHWTQKEKKALEVVNNVYSEIRSTFANDKSENIHCILKAIEEEKFTYGSPLYSRIYDRLKRLFCILLATGHLDFCKKYCILNRDNTEIEKFTFTSAVLEANTANDDIVYRNRPNNPALIWYYFKEAHIYWYRDSCYFENPNNFKNRFEMLTVNNVRYEIFSSKSENVLKCKQYKKIIFNKELFINGLKTLVTDIYKNL